VYLLELVHRHHRPGKHTRRGRNESRNKDECRPVAGGGRPQRVIKPHHGPPTRPKLALPWNAYIYLELPTIIELPDLRADKGNSFQERPWLMIGHRRYGRHRHPGIARQARSSRVYAALELLGRLPLCSFLGWAIIWADAAVQARCAGLSLP
jgi:hypothetical protein